MKENMFGGIAKYLQKVCAGTLLLEERIPKPNDPNTNPICLIWEFFAKT